MATPTRHKRTVLGADSSGRDITFERVSHILVAGAAASGTSWVLRSLAADVFDEGQIVFIDPTGSEAYAWTGIAKTAVTPDEITEALADAVAEMDRRVEHLRHNDYPAWDGEPYTLAVDNGAALLATCKDGRLADRIERLAVMGRSVGFGMWWATSNARTTGALPGATPYLFHHFDYRFALRTANRMQTEVALGVGGGEAHKLTEPGTGYLAGREGLIAVRPFTDEAMRGLGR